MHKFIGFIIIVMLAISARHSLAEEKRVVVVGAGIVGASITYHLALAGKEVTIIDMEGPASHSSRGTFAWINASWAKQPQHYHALNQKSTRYWHEISNKLSIPVKFKGSLEWFDAAERQQKLVAQIAEQQRWGEPAEILDLSEAEQREPNVQFGDTKFVASSPRDGAVDPVLATKKLLTAAKQLGATVKYPCKLLSVQTSAEQSFAKTSCGDLPYHTLVLAVGAASDVIASIAKVSIPQRTTPGIIVVSKPMKPLLNGILVAPGVHIHQRLDGTIVLGEQEGAPKTQAHQVRLVDRPNSYPNEILAKQHAQRIIDIATQYIPAMSNAEIKDVFIGWRPLPLDGHPVLGYSKNAPNVYIAVTHSGVTLAPLIGKLAAQEIMQNKPNSMLEFYRPDRVFEQVKRY
ncbi:NAD(P)/FAD-dependent oxidoreductase [Glaciecola petra]|uniref:FAD-dependent oxidoreductase n=1 Tax=Glaciecola petra TaxID=3075602 RepID=A0ABU2ZPR3_9ALTE|nr:FAD-dependent oxidoreductase [Aestuariibacter sp. P117]MDT0594616.1 FAD-dependent oxidoreductase [Aestuariibacter sp. P117]